MVTIVMDNYKIIPKIIKIVFIIKVNSNIEEIYKTTYFKDKELCITKIMNLKVILNAIN